MGEAQPSQTGGVNVAGESVNVGRDVAGRDIVYNITTQQSTDPAILKDVEGQLNTFLDQFVVLHRQLEEWKDLHNVLQDLQVRFTTCRSYALELGRREQEEGGVLGMLTKAPSKRAQRVERLLYEFSLNWQQCKLTLDQLRRFTTGLRYTGTAYDPHAQTGPEPMKALDRLQRELDEALHDEDRYNLADLIGEFAKQIDDYLYLADKALRDVAKEINRLPQQIRFTAHT